MCSTRSSTTTSCVPTARATVLHLTRKVCAHSHAQYLYAQYLYGCTSNNIHVALAYALAHEGTHTISVPKVVNFCLLIPLTCMHTHEHTHIQAITRPRCIAWRQKLSWLGTNLSFQRVPCSCTMLSRTFTRLWTTMTCPTWRYSPHTLIHIQSIFINSHLHMRSFV